MRYDGGLVLVAASLRRGGFKSAQRCIARALLFCVARVCVVEVVLNNTRLCGGVRCVRAGVLLVCVCVCVRACVCLCVMPVCGSV